MFTPLRLKRDVDTLARLTNLDSPPVLKVCNVLVMVGYLVGDTSGTGYGSSFLFSGEESISLAHGSWSEAVSNFREVANLVRRVEELFSPKK